MVRARRVGAIISGGWGATIQGRRLFQIIPQKGGDYSRGRLIEGRLLFEEIRYVHFVNCLSSFCSVLYCCVLMCFLTYRGSYLARRGQSTKIDIGKPFDKSINIDINHVNVIDCIDQSIKIDTHDSSGNYCYRCCRFYRWTTSIVHVFNFWHWFCIEKTFNRGKMIAVALFTNKTVFCISVNLVY